MTKYLIKVKEEDVDPAIERTHKTPLDKLFRQFSQIAKFTGIEVIEGHNYYIHTFIDKEKAIKFGSLLLRSRHKVKTEVVKATANVNGKS